MYEVFARLLAEKGLRAADVTRATGIKSPVFSEWKKGKSRPNADKMLLIANYLGVSVEYLLTGKENSSNELNARDEKDIKKDLDSIMEKLTSGEAGPAAYDGEPLSPEAAALFREELEIALKRLKLINKEKYNPYKHKK